MARLGVDLLFVQHFDLGFAAKSAEDFLSTKSWSARSAPRMSSSARTAPSAIAAAATPDLLRAAGAEYGFGVTVIEPMRGADEAVYSSTQIRELLKAGKPREAAALLGRFWEIDGRVAVGDRRGRTIGFPTANLGLGEYIRRLSGSMRCASRATAPTTRSPAAPSTASPISACARRSARPSRGSKRIFSTSTRISMAGICGWRWSISSGRSRNSPASTR